MSPGLANAPKPASSPSEPSTPGSSGSSPRAPRHVTDVTNASRTMLFNIHTMDWDDDLLRLLGVPRSMPASGRRLQRRVRHLLRSHRRHSHRRYRRRPAGRALWPDVHLARHGQVHLRHRSLHAAEHRSGAEGLKNKLLTTVAWKIGNTVEYAFEGSMLMAGAVVQWLRDDLQIIRTSAEVESSPPPSPTPTASSWSPPSPG